MNGPEQPGDHTSGEHASALGSEPALARAQRMLCVDESERSLAAFGALARDYDLLVEQSTFEALAALERTGDFAVVLVATEPARRVATSRFLEAARAISPTTARVVLAHGVAAAEELAFDAAFHVVSAGDSPAALRDAISRALDYHRLLATSPAQPVDVARFDRAAMLPPARSQRRRQALPAWQGFIESARQLTAEPIRIEEQAPAPPLLVLGGAEPRVGVCFEGRTVELLHGDTIVGRSRSCHISIGDPRISRRHACFSNDGGELTVRNLSSTNALSINGKLLELDDAQRLAIGDRIGLGSREIEVCALGDYFPSLEPTEQIPLGGPAEGPAAPSTLATLAQVAEKYFALGHAREAERVARPLLAGLLRYCQEERVPVASDIDRAVSLALRIVESSRAGEWVDYLFELFTALARPMTLELVDRLYRVIPEVQGAKMACFRRYADTLLARQDGFGPRERFQLRRIQGLEQPLMMSAHV